MLVVMSTNGPWATDNMGVVGIIEGTQDLRDFITKHYASAILCVGYPESEGDEMIESDITDGEIIRMHLEASELSVPSTGTIIRLIEMEGVGDNTYGEIYIAIEF